MRDRRGRDEGELCQVSKFTHHDDLGVSEKVLLYYLLLQRYLPLGIGLCYLGKQDAAEATMAALEVNLLFPS